MMTPAPHTGSFSIADIPVGSGAPLVLLAGPCVVESREIIFHTAERLVRICERLCMPLVFKSSFRKANRTSISGFQGLGDEAALRILDDVKREYRLPIVTDIHAPEDATAAADVADILQIPAFLSRQTDLLLAAGATGRVVNIKKGQFMAPEDMRHAAAKVASTGNARIMVCERGTSFGYHDLVVDMRGLVVMRELGYPVVMDATHAVQAPSVGDHSGGNPRYIAPLARAAAAVGIDALFMETHPDPATARSDAASQLPLGEIEAVLRGVLDVDAAVRRSASPAHVQEGDAQA